jgi:hypothetical protein
MTQDDRKLLEEIADRARRTETRVTKVANHLGIDAGGEKPTWDNARPSECANPQDVAG